MLKFFLIAGGIYCFMAGYLYVMQRNMMYFSTPERNHRQAQVIWLEANQQRLKIWRINEASPAILYFGGNAESVDYNIADFKSLFRDYSVYLVNYRGYGGSSGAPTESGLMQDALAVYDMVGPQHASVSVIGRSLGSAIALHVASQREVERLALITPFDSLKNVAQSHYPLFPVKWLMKDPYDAISLADQIDHRVLVLTAEHDRIIPPRHSEKLVQALTRARVESHVIADSGHNDLSLNPSFDRLLGTFFRR